MTAACGAVGRRLGRGSNLDPMDRGDICWGCGALGTDCRVSAPHEQDD